MNINVFAFSGLLTGILSFLLGLFVLIKSKNSKPNIIWGIFCFFAAIWGFGGYEVGLANTPELGLFWWRVTYVGIIFIPVLFYHFTYEFLKLKNLKVLFSIYLFGFIYLLLEWSPLADLFFGIKNISYLFNSLYWVYPPTFLFIFFVFSWFLIIFYSHFELFKSFRNSIGLKRAQIGYFFIATAMGFLGGGTCFLPCFGVILYPFFNYTVSLYPLIIAYAIIKHRLMDIKFVLRKSSVYLSSLCTIIILAIIVRYCFAYLGIESDYVDFLILVLSLSLFSPIKHYYYRIANKYFFTSLYDAQKVIADLSEKLRKSLELKTIYGFVSESLLNAFHAKAIAILIFNEKKGIYTIKFEKGFNFSAKKQFSEDDVLHELFVKQNKVVIIEELKSSFYDKYKNEIDSIANLNIELMMPLNVKDKNIGLIILGHKESGDMYNDEDLQVLQIVGAQTAIAVENALSYDKVKNFNLKLKKEVEEATAELRAANKKLIELDQTKSDFISIASHQLRTPLTVIKGYISMILEGSFGSLTDQENDSLKKVYQSNERLIQLVENLLDISRIESGRLEFNFKEGRLESVVDSVVDELKGNAGAKGLKLEYKKPAKPLPKIIFDEQKIRQVIMNLIDNAIKYTKQGSISVEIGAQGKNINFCVADTGMGVSQSDMPNLFMKFSRGKGVSLVHTSGSGLGLYVGRMMIEAHKGKIWGESAGADKGAKFCFSLPIKNNLINVKVEKKNV